MLRTGSAAAFGALAICAACGQLIGAEFDDLELQPDASAGDSGDAGGGSGGTPGSGGSGATAGSAGGGASGASGTFGAGGSGGAQASGGAGGGSAAGGGGGDSGSSGTTGSGGSSAAGGSAGTAGTGGTAGSGGMPDAGSGIVVINEVEGRAGNEDFIELYNPGSVPIDIGGYKVADAEGTDQRPKIAEAVVFPSPSVLAPGGYAIVVGNQGGVGGPFTCLNFSPCFQTQWGISASGERVYLLAPDDTELEYVDYPSESSPEGMRDGQSFGRYPNGTGAFSRTTISPGQPNLAAPNGEP
jgi:hypothetical protein